MSFDLMNDAGEAMTFSNSGWRYMIEFATVHGYRWPTLEDGDETATLTEAQAHF